MIGVCHCHELKALVWHDWYGDGIYLRSGMNVGQRVLDVLDVQCVDFSDPFGLEWSGFELIPNQD